MKRKEKGSRKSSWWQFPRTKDHFRSKESENAKGRNNRNEKTMKKINGDKKGMIIFNSKKWWSKWKNEKMKKHDFQSLAGWDEHKTRSWLACNRCRGRNVCSVCRAPVPPGQAVNVLIRRLLSSVWIWQHVQATKRGLDGMVHALMFVPESSCEGLVRNELLPTSALTPPTFTSSSA